MDTHGGDVLLLMVLNCCADVYVTPENGRGEVFSLMLRAFIVHERCEEAGSVSA